MIEDVPLPLLPQRLSSDDTGVSPTRTRLRFAAAYKLKILEAAAQGTKPELGHNEAERPDHVIVVSPLCHDLFSAAEADLSVLHESLVRMEGLPPPTSAATAIVGDG